MTTITVEGHGQFSATPAMTARFEAMSKPELMQHISDGYGGDPSKGGKALYAARHFRQFSKETLVIVAADMFASDEERSTEPVQPGADTFYEGQDVVEPLADVVVKASAPVEPAALDDGTQNPEAGEPADVVVREDYPGQHVAGPDEAPPSTAEPVGPPSATEPAPVSPVADPAGPKPRGYRFRCTLLAGWLRRDQPRKPGDVAKWRRVEDVSKSSMYRTLGQATKALAEIASLYDDRDHQAVLEVVA